MTAPAYAHLEAAGVDTLDLVEAEGVIVEDLDLGFPTIRSVTSLRPDADGELDETAHIGARAVTISGVIVATDALNRQQVLDRIRTFLRPGLRPYIVYRLEPDGDERRIRLRADQHAAPISFPETVAFSASWRGPDGVQEANEETTATLSAATDIEAGRTYDRSYDRSYPDSPPVGVTTVTNDGNLNVYPILRLYGPCTGPNIENQTAGKALELPGLVVDAGDYVELDTRNRTIRLLGDPDQSRYTYLDTATSAWWSLAPGDNDLRYYPSSFSVGAAAEVIYRANWL